MNSFKPLFFVIFIINIFKINAQISDKRLCFDEECKVPISQAKTLLNYNSPDPLKLSFKANEEAIIYSKSAGSKMDLWGVEIKGKRGYVPFNMLREQKVLKTPKLLVDTESAKVPSDTLEPNKVQQPYEVIDGTTVYSNDDIVPSSTENPVQATSVPTLDVNNNIEQKNETTEEKKDEEVVEDPDEDDEDDDDDLPEEKSSVEATTAVPIVPASQKLEDSPVEISRASEVPTEVKQDLPEAVENVETASLGDDAELLTAEAATPLTPNSENNADTTKQHADAASEPIEKEANLPTIEEIIVPDPVPEIQTVVKDAVVESSDSNAEQVEKVTSKPAEMPATDSNAEEVEKITSKPFLSSFAESLTGSLEKVEELLLSPPSIQTENTDKIEDTTGQIIEENIPMIEPIKSDEVLASSNDSETLKETETDQVPSEDEANTIKSDESSIDSPQKVEEIATIQPPEVNEIVDIENTINETTTKLDDVPSITNPQSVLEETQINDSHAIEDTPESSTPNDITTETTLSENYEVPPPEVEEITENPSVDEANISQDNEESTGGFFSNIFSSLFASKEESTDIEAPNVEEFNANLVETFKEPIGEETCGNQSDFLTLNPDILTYLVTTAISVIVFLFGYIAFDKSKREGPLIGKINKLEKELHILLKENQILQGEGADSNAEMSSEFVQELKLENETLAKDKSELEERVQYLEKELETSTEVGMEVNRMLSEFLSSDDRDNVLKANVEHLQRQLVEQQSTVNSVNETLALAKTENHELKLELEITNKKVIDLQSELDKMLLNVIKIQDDKDQQQTILEQEIRDYKTKSEQATKQLNILEQEKTNELQILRNDLSTIEHDLKLKTKAYEVLNASIKELKVGKNEETVRKIINSTEIKAELDVLREENERINRILKQEQETKAIYEKRVQETTQQYQELKTKFDEIDKARVENETKLQVLGNYFKEKEAELQREISKHESLWVEKEGEATSTTERITFLQEQLQNYKTQNESLKQEIVSQEVELKSQISMLEKKVHENWMSVRQTERKLEDARQESAQLRHRLTLREKEQRIQSPMENGQPISPVESPPPLLYSSRDHITKSPIGLPFLPPPPPGVPFMPPPPPHFMPPPPPSMFPGDHRPPPLGRMSSPPLNSRYSPSSRGYSPYDSSPSDSEYGRSPPPQRRDYSPFNNLEERRDYKRGPPPRNYNNRNVKGSSGSNESLEKNRSKV